MPKFKIEATRKIYVFAIVEANNEEEAERLYDKELVSDDFEEEGGSWTLGDISELEA